MWISDAITLKYLIGMHSILIIIKFVTWADTSKLIIVNYVIMRCGNEYYKMVQHQGHGSEA